MLGLLLEEFKRYSRDSFECSLASSLGWRDRIANLQRDQYWKGIAHHFLTTSWFPAFWGMYDFGNHGGLRRVAYIILLGMVASGVGNDGSLGRTRGL